MSVYSTTARLLQIIVFLLDVLTTIGLSHGFPLGTAEAEIRPYLRVGTIAWDQLGGVGGHKSLVGAGFTTNVNWERVGTRLAVEKWWVAEGLDDDQGIIPKEGYSLSGDARYDFRLGSFRLFPFAGLGYDTWEDRGAPASWDTLRFLSWRAGAGLDHDRGYISAGLLRPFAVNAVGGSDPTARYGFTVEGGIRVNAVTIGLFYKSLGFQDPDAKIVQSSVFVGYHFK